MATASTATSAIQENTLLPCDVVMKGGVTSGVVYPPAISELAKTYRFMNIGGTSAGAIAAVCTAAAERARQNGNAQAFSALDQLSQELGGNGFILSLFQPTPWTWPLFKIALSFVGSKPMLLRFVTALAMAFACFWPMTLGALMLDALLGWWLVQTAASPGIWLLALVVMLVIIGLAWLLGLIWSVVAAIPNNYLGLCSGSGGRARKPPLTDWLAAKIDGIAGIAQGAGPLTFGELWGVGSSPDAEKAQSYAALPPKLDGPAPTLDQIRGNANINLEMITTCLTLGRPYRMPIATRIFFVDPVDAHTLFPKYVAAWLLDHAAPPRSKDEAILYRLLEPLVPLPPPEAFPVVVAARMSLSFPILLSAVKLYAIDYTRQDSVDASALIEKLAADDSFDLDHDRNDPRLDPIKQKVLAEPCWFSDGGLTHNFPVQFFDGPLPRWPTFAIDLDALPDGVSDSNPGAPGQYVKLPEHNVQGIAPTWNRIGRPRGPASLLSFVGAIVDTMQNWTDNMQSQMPGYRDRIVHVLLAQDEGGLNLNMPPSVVQKLAARGREAGAVLTQAFAQPPAVAPQWLNHRFVRYRNFMALFEPLLTAFQAKYSYDFRPGPSYETLINAPPSYKWHSTEQKDFAKAKTGATNALAQDIGSSTESFLNGEPHPQGELTVRPVL